MKALHQKKEEDLSIVSAVEALSNIADLEFEAVSHDAVLAEERESGSTVIRAVRWLHQKNAERMLGILRDKLTVVLNYLRHFYRAEKNRFARSESVEGIRTIMLLVDEAADNLDRYTKLFLGAQAKSIKSTKEFLDLCRFYKKKILPIATHTKVASWIKALPLQTILESAVAAPTSWTEIPSLGILGVEIEGIKNDSEYELLFLRQPDGTRFVSPKMLRSLKLASEVENVTKRDLREDQEVEHLSHAQSSTEIRYLLGEVYPLLDAFFHMGQRAKGHEVYLGLYKPCIALLAASVQAVHQFPKEGSKSAEEYFRDFRSSFNEFLHMPEFQRMLAYPPHNEHSWEHSLFRLAQAFSSSLIAGAPLSEELVEGMKALASQALAKEAEHVGVPDGTISQQLSVEGSALRSFFKELKGGLLSQMIQVLEERGSLLFEPLLEESIPNHLFDLSWRGALIPIIRLPSPTRQEYINKATISEVFQVAIRRYLSQKKGCLVINLQDRTSWKESARSGAIEDFCKKGEKEDRLFVFTQNRESDFYSQTGSFADMHLAEEFKEQLLSQIIETGSGSLWPVPFDEHFTQEVKALIQTIHVTLFNGRNVITRIRRMAFIELVYNLMILRAILMVHPDVIFISCKNGLDTALSTISSLFSLQAALQGTSLSQTDVDWLRTILFGMPLIQRHRLLFPERQEGLCSFIRFLENTIAVLGKSERKTLRESLELFLPHEMMKAAFLPASGQKPTDI